MIARTFTATDNYGRTNTCTQNITLVNNTAPVFDPTCQIDATFTTKNGNVWCPAEVSILLSEGDELTFAEDVEQPSTVEPYSIFGQELFRQTFQQWPQEGINIDTQRLPNGTYLLRVTREGGAPN